MVCIVDEVWIGAWNKLKFLSSAASSSSSRKHVNMRKDTGGVMER